MSKAKPSQKTTTKNKQTNNHSVLDSIPKAINDKVIQCANERKSLLIIGGNKEQKNILAKQIHSVCCQRVSKDGRQMIQRETPGTVAQLLTINCMYYRNKQEFHDDIDKILNGGPFVIDSYLQAEENQMAHGGDTIPERYHCVDIPVLFIDNLDSLSSDDDLLRKVARLANYKFKSFKPVIIVSINSPKKLHDWFREPFEEVSLISKPIQEAVQQKIKFKEAKIVEQGLKSIESTLIYTKKSGKFRFKNSVSIAVSATSRAKVRNMVEKLMKWWGKGKPCPLSEIVKDPRRKTPQSIYDNISTIRNVLKDLKVNLPQCTDEKYPPPSEPELFDIVD